MQLWPRMKTGDTEHSKVCECGDAHQQSTEKSQCS